MKKSLQFPEHSCIIATVVTLIAEKREVAVHDAGFSVERMSSYETGDKSLYQSTYCEMQGREQKTCEGLWDTHGNVYSHRLSYLV